MLTIKLTVKFSIFYRIQNVVLISWKLKFIILNILYFHLGKKAPKIGIKINQLRQNQIQKIYYLTFCSTKTNIYYFLEAFITLETIFCSSTRKALTILVLTASADRHPPYALVTCLVLLDIDMSCFGRAGLIPNNFFLVSGQTGIDPNFLRCKYTNLPPGVFEILLRFDEVL